MGEITCEVCGRRVFNKPLPLRKLDDESKSGGEEMIQRYKVEGRCVDKDDYGFYVHYVDHQAEIERLKATEQQAIDWAKLAGKNQKQIEMLADEIESLKERLKVIQEVDNNWKEIEYPDGDEWVDFWYEAKEAIRACRCLMKACEVKE